MKMRRMFAAAAAVALVPCWSHAALTYEYVTTPTATANWAPTFSTPVSTTDLLSTFAKPSSQSGFFDAEVTVDRNNVSEPTDGVFVLNADKMFVAGGTNYLQYNLATPANVSAINTYGGWYNRGRDHQLIQITYSVVDGVDSSLPDLSLPLIDADNLTLSDNTLQSAIAAYMTDLGLTNVDAIRFTFPSPQENTYAGYAEFDVIGSVPETASIGLMGLGIGGMMMRRRRA